MLLFNKLQRFHSTLKMTEKEVALQCVLLKLFNPPSFLAGLSILLYNYLSEGSNTKANTKCINVQNAKELITSITH